MGAGTKNKGPHVDNFCMCFGLRSGTIIIGVLCSILFMASFVSEAMWLRQTQSLQTIESGLGIVHMLLFFIMTTLSLLMTVGGVSEKSAYLTPWLNCGIVYIVVSIIAVIVFALSGALVWLCSLIFDLVFVYFIIVVWSYRDVIRGVMH